MEAYDLLEKIAITTVSITDVEELERLRQMLLLLADRIEDKIIDLEPEPEA